MPKALFIVFEGIDGSGTTTQSELLARYITEELENPVVLTREPGGTPLAERIRTLVLDPDFEEIHFITELLLYAASRAQHVHELIKPTLQAGTPVVCDRFTDSTVAYQGYGRGLDLDMIRKVNSIAIGGCRPDLAIYLELPVEVARKRRQQRASKPDRLERAGDQLQGQVHRAYRELAVQNPGASLVLDATLPVNELADEISSLLRSRWSNFPFGN